MEPKFRRSDRLHSSCVQKVFGLATLCFLAQAPVVERPNSQDCGAEDSIASTVLKWQKESDGKVREPTVSPSNNMRAPRALSV